VLSFFAMCLVLNSSYQQAYNGVFTQSSKRPANFQQP